MKLIGLKILVVDDDHLFREILKKCIETEGAKVMAVESVAQAKQAMPIFSPDAILTDTEMPGETALGLLNWVITHYPKIPVVMMTGFSELLDASMAAHAGAVGFLHKPFKEEELFKTLWEALMLTKGPSPNGITLNEVTSLSADAFLKISVEDFITGSKINVPIFVKTPSSKGDRFVKIAHNGEDLASDRIATYRAKGLKYFHLIREDYMQYVGFTMQLTRAATSRTSNIPIEKQVQLVRHTMDMVTQNFFETEISEEMLDHATTLVEVGVSVLAGNEGGFLALDSLKNISNELYAHSTAVSMISCLIGKALGWTSPRTLSKVSIGGMLHDTGKRQLPKELATKQKALMTPAEIIQYETHPQRAMEMLSDLSFVPSDVIQAVYQHHERTNGTGFPNRLMDSKIFPIAKIIAVADEFCHLYFKSKEREKLNPKEALKKLMAFYADGLDPEMLIALHHVFKEPIPESLQKCMKNDLSRSL